MTTTNTAADNKPVANWFTSWQRTYGVAPEVGAARYYLAGFFGSADITADMEPSITRELKIQSDICDDYYKIMCSAGEDGGVAEFYHAYLTAVCRLLISAREAIEAANAEEAGL